MSPFRRSDPRFIPKHLIEEWKHARLDGTEMQPKPVHPVQPPPTLADAKPLPLPSIKPKRRKRTFPHPLYPTLPQSHTPHSLYPTIPHTHTPTSQELVSIAFDFIEKEYREKSVHHPGPRRPLEEIDGELNPTGQLPYHMNEIVMSDREEREAEGITPKDYGNKGKKWKAPFRSVLGDAPKLGPGDREGARVFASRIREVMDNLRPLSPSERVNLFILHRKWQKRADGEDARFEVVGNRTGYVDPDEREKIERTKMLMEIRQMRQRRKA